jgi:hypothetical protein
MDLSHLNGWQHLGSPPQPRSSPLRIEQWHRDGAQIRGALRSLRAGWSEELPQSSSEFRARVWQLEDVSRSVSDAGGYGNLLLAEAARRLSLALVAGYAVRHGADHEVVGDLLSTSRRVRLLDCPAVSEMLKDELELTPPSGGWRLSESWDHLKVVLAADGSTPRDLGFARMLRKPGLTSLLEKRGLSRTKG